MFDDFYGLTGRPFQLTPDPDFYFESATHRKALSYLGYGLAQGEGFIVVTGEIGSGKSTLAAHLMQRIDGERLTVGQIVTSALDGEELIHLVAQSFGLSVEGHDKAAALGAIEQFLHEEARAGRRCLLVVDESQNLTVAALEELRMLSNFQLGAHPLLQLLLLGQPEFRQVLAEHESLEQLRQRVIAAHHLEPMEQAELEPYIRHRLEKVGWDGNPAFDQRVFTELFEATKGIPRQINQVMTRLLLLGAVEQRSRIDSAMLSAVLKEMRSDSAFPSAAPRPMPRVEPTLGDSVKQIAHGQAGQGQGGGASASDMLRLLAERDAQIGELQQAVIELADKHSAGVRLPADHLERLAEIEARLAEQETLLRRTLTMLIEWIERNDNPRAAA